MSDKNETQDASAESSSEADPPSRGRKKLLVVASVVVLLAAGYTFLAPKSADAAAEDAAVAPTPGEVVALDPITLNLADGRFLKVGIALQLVEGAVLPAEDAVAGYSAPAVDVAISFLGSRTYDELVAPGGRDVAKTELSARIAAAYPDEVMGVYFTELVMQ